MRVGVRKGFVVAQQVGGHGGTATDEHGDAGCGQQQRVAIARALAGEPEILLADEPAGALDSHTSEEIMQLLETSNEAGQTIVFITHNPDLAKRTKRRVAISDGHMHEEKEVRR